MDPDAVRQWCRTRPGVTEERPFRPDNAVFKVAGKMFAAISDGSLHLNLKCDPHWAEALRERYKDSVTAGYHMNKRHWNTVLLDGSVPAGEVEEMLGHSYTIVVDGLPAATRARLRGA